MPKSGRLLKSDERRISELADAGCTIEEIAKELDRSEHVIKGWLEKNKRPTDANSPLAIRQDLLNSLAWKNLKKQFDAEELDYFQEEYIKWMGQFRDDVLPSEEAQIFDVIKVGIMLNRCLARQNSNREDIEELKERARAIYDKYKNASEMQQGDRNLVATIEQRISILESSEQSHITEYTKLAKEKNDLMKHLKATREQRVKQVEDNSRFIDLVKLFQKLDVQKQESRHMELMRQGTQKEFDRLSSPHKYMDEQVDLPILSAETLEKWDAIEEEKPDEET